MELKIDIDETKFKDVIEKELGAFTKEELHDIIKDCIVKAFNSEEIFKSFFVKQEEVGYYKELKITPGPLLVEAANSIDLTNECKDIADTLIKTLKENHKELIVDLLLRLILNGISNDYDFQNKLKSSIDFIVRNSYNNGGN